MDSLWHIATLGFYVAAAIGAVTLAAWSFPRRQKLGPAGPSLVGALCFTAGWLAAVPSIGGTNPFAYVLFSLTNLAWLWTLYRLFASDNRHQNVRPIRSVVLALGMVEVLQFVLILADMRFGAYPQAADMVFRMIVTLRLLFTVGALVLVHNLYGGADSASRQALRWPAIALAVMWLYDLNLFTIAYLMDALPGSLHDLRGFVLLVMVGLFALWATGGRASINFRPSRSVAFQSISLLLIGGYLIAMVLLAQGLSYAGGDLPRLVQTAFVIVAGAGALIFLPSKRLRGWVRVTLAKHFFQHRYDYRAEWLRFTKTIGHGGSNRLPLEERVVQALADITDSPKGLLLKPTESGDFSLHARWGWPHVEVPAVAVPAELAARLVKDDYVLEIADVRNGKDERFKLADLPEWLVNETEVWALVPLAHYGRLVGLVALSHPIIARKLDWEDFDLLRVVGQQLASYLSEQEGQEALIEAQRFDEFNRRIAFVMHDIKNLASQLSLLARNAEKHSDNPEFRADMLVTLRNSADKLNGLLSRLGRYGSSGADKMQEIDLVDCARGIVARWEGAHQVMLVDQQPVSVLAAREPLEQALAHLIQNAVDASNENAPVYVNVSSDGVSGTIEVVDSGCGMSPEFLRRHLFKPFHSSKQGGFGIGAFEARELIRAMQGRLEVESREGLGTRFLVKLPRPSTIFSDTMHADTSASARNEVA